MNISLDEVNRIAKLSRLSFNENEKKKLQEELSSILDYVGQVQKLQSSADGQSANDLDGVNLMREDVAVSAIAPEELLAQAPDRQGNFVKVKSILE